MEEIRKFPFSSIAGALQYQARTRPDSDAIFYPDLNTNSTEYAILTYKQYNNVTDHLAEKIFKYLPSSLISNEPIICGLLAVDGFNYLLCQYALLKLPNVIKFPISPRNSQAAIEHLLKETKTSVLIITSQFLSMIQLIQQKEKFQSLKVLLLDSDEFNIEHLLKKKDLECTMTFNKISNDEELNRIVVIIHSSGSTDYPKPIYLTNRYLLANSILYSSINKDFWREDDVVLVWGPLFHVFAFYGTVFAIIIGYTYALPLCVTFPPKPNELLHNLQVKNGITVLLTIPSLLEQVVEEILSEKSQPISFKSLTNLRFVIYGGANCSNELCQTLVDNNVILLSVYGSTETGLVLIKNFNLYDKKWKYMEVANIRKTYVRIETVANTENPNEKILIHLPNNPFLAENISNYPNNCYITGDIFLEDPPHSQQFIIVGRQDDTLVHINGEKTNPVPIENIIRYSPLVKQVVVIGHNQFCTGILIQLNIEEASNYDFDEIQENIWQFIEQANQKSPSHSRIIRPLVRIIPMNKILSVTHKGNLIRHEINEEYSKLIEKMYKKFFNEQQEELKNNYQWTKETIKLYLQAKFKIETCSKSIFDFGINSLQILEIRNAICQDICQIPKNFLYEFSSIDQMVEKLIKSENFDPFHYKLTEDILNKYIDLMKNTNIISSFKQNQEKKQRIFLITGANSSLGNFLIRDLLKQSKSIIYCLLRGSNPQQRLFDSFKQRQLNISFDERIIILPQSMNLSEEKFGQTDEVYEELKNEITDVIHLAWKMDFNQTIKDFEYDCILGIYNLLKFSAFNQKQFHFISSISSAGSGRLSTIKEEPLPRLPEIALPHGYGQSKYIGEHLCWTARTLWDIPVNTYRIGQISGDTENGIWNIHEMTSMMIYAGAGQLKKLPNIGEDINWIPIDICSNSLVYLILKSSFQNTISVNERVYHLVNPNLVKYEDYLDLLHQAGLNFDIVSPKIFSDSILTTKDKSNPLLKLSSFFEQSFNDNGILELAKYETIKTTEKCPILKNCPKIDLNLIKLYLSYWKTCQVL